MKLLQIVLGAKTGKGRDPHTIPRLLCPLYSSVDVLKADAWHRELAGEILHFRLEVLSREGNTR